MRRSGCCLRRRASRVRSVGFIKAMEKARRVEGGCIYVVRGAGNLNGVLDVRLRGHGRGMRGTGTSGIADQMSCSPKTRAFNGSK
jgi:hypothetical protein